MASTSISRCAPVRAVAKLAFRTRQRQLQRAAPFGGGAFIRRERAARRLAPFGLGLLKLDVLALEASRHVLFVIFYARSHVRPHEACARVRHAVG